MFVEKFKWKVYGCNSAQACKYLAFLSKSMRYSSVINYYQTVIFYHYIKGRAVASWSDPMLAQTVKGITNLETVPEDVKRLFNWETFKNNVSICQCEKVSACSILDYDNFPI